MYAGGFIMPQPRASAIPLKAASATRITKESAMVGRLSTLVIVLAFTKTAPSFKLVSKTGFAGGEYSKSQRSNRRVHYVGVVS